MQNDALQHRVGLKGCNHSFTFHVTRCLSFIMYNQPFINILPIIYMTCVILFLCYHKTAYFEMLEEILDMTTNDKHLINYPDENFHER